MKEIDSAERAPGPRPFHGRVSRYPQSSLVRSLLDRRLMTLADRGGSSGYVGTAWGDYSRDWLESLVGGGLLVGESFLGTVQSVLDVDALPGLPSFASSRGMQNPDFILTLETDNGPALVAVDAKFSIETAKPRQVSAEIIRALMETPGSPVRQHIQGEFDLLDGFFTSPEYELTHLVLSGRGGILRAVVRPSQFVLLQVDPTRIFDRPDLIALMDRLNDIDQAQSDWRSDLVSALYYARCAFACVGCRVDEVKPLLGSSETRQVDLIALETELVRRAGESGSAWALVDKWDRDADEIRALRIRIHQAADIGIMNRDLRNLIERSAERAGMPIPSTNRVRRELASWTMSQLAREVGTILYPVDDVDALVNQLRRSVALLSPQIPAQVRTIVEGTRAS